MGKINTVEIAITGNKMLILCLESFFRKHGAEELIKAAFPRFTRANLVEGHDYLICSCWKVRSSVFDQAIIECEEENDWEKQPCIAMKVEVRKGERSCRYWPFSL
ncbi:MAG: hypothetical protein Q7T50_01805 [Candidatus Magasanikbacteria bacterium]|nr:hypothetical protein [Candidatus Magasanikbacteria bacterium]